MPTKICVFMLGTGEVSALKEDALSLGNLECARGRDFAILYKVAALSAFLRGKRFRRLRAVTDGDFLDANFLHTTEQLRAPVQGAKFRLCPPPPSALGTFAMWYVAWTGLPRMSLREACCVMGGEYLRKVERLHALLFPEAPPNSTCLLAANWRRADCEPIARIVPRKPVFPRIPREGPTISSFQIRFHDEGSFVEDSESRDRLAFVRFVGAEPQCASGRRILEVVGTKRSHLVQVRPCGHEDFSTAYSTVIGPLKGLIFGFDRRRAPHFYWP